MAMAARYQPPLVYRPHSAVFWVYVGAVTLGAIGVVVAFGPVIAATLRANLMLAPIWAVFIVVLVRIILLFDPFRAVRQMPQVLAAAMALGGTAALLMALNGNDAMNVIISGLVGPEFASAWSAALSAPIIEEASKATCAAVILVLCADRVNRIAHALMVGMFVGLGFDLFEDLVYQVQSAISDLDSDLAGAGPELGIRILTGFPSHWAYTALTAVGVLLLLPSFASRRQWPARQRWTAAAALFFSAWLMHFLWDSPPPSALDDQPAWAGWAFLFLKVLVNLTIFLGAVIMLLRHERRWLVGRTAELSATDGVLAQVDPQILASLPTYKSRRALRKAARRAGGKTAARAVAREQRTALDLIQNAEPAAPYG